ncbi:MAG: hypothetical protein U9R19_13905 [Bacteroidota bacterium]|nr:hypothetical protein [Bacteroidota bacterium]
MKKIRFKDFQYLIEKSLSVRVASNKKDITIKFCVKLPDDVILEAQNSDTWANHIGDAIAIYKVVGKKGQQGDIHTETAYIHLKDEYDKDPNHESGVKVEVDEESMLTADGHGFLNVMKKIEVTVKTKNE